MCSQIINHPNQDRFLLRQMVQVFENLSPHPANYSHIELSVQSYIDAFPGVFPHSKNMIWHGDHIQMISMKSVLALYLENQISKMGFRVHSERGLYFLKTLNNQIDSPIELLCPFIENSDLLLIDDAGQDYRWLDQNQIRILHHIFTLREQLKLPYVFLSQLKREKWLALFGIDMEKHFAQANCQRILFNVAE